MPANYFNKKYSNNSRYAEITRKKGNIHYNVNFMPLYDINDSRIIDKFSFLKTALSLVYTPNSLKAYILMCQQINISIKNIATHYSNLKVIFFINIFLKTD